MLKLIQFTVALTTGVALFVIGTGVASAHTSPTIKGDTKWTPSKIQPPPDQSHLSKGLPSGAPNASEKPVTASPKNSRPGPGPLPSKPSVSTSRPQPVGSTSSPCLPPVLPTTKVPMPVSPSTSAATEPLGSVPVSYGPPVITPVVRSDAPSAPAMAPAAGPPALATTGADIGLVSTVGLTILILGVVALIIAAISPRRKVGGKDTTYVDRIL